MITSTKIMRTRKTKNEDKSKWCDEHHTSKKLDYKNYNASKQIAKVLYEKNYTKFTLFDNNRDINDTP